MGLFSTIFGSGKSAAIKEMLEAGAVVIDVRTHGEYQNGHVPASVNIPLQQIGSNTQKIKNLDKPIIFCCASGMRSGQAARQIKSVGVNCINGGSWTQVARISEN